MEKGSYTQIKPGMQVVGEDGETIGAVSEVVVDEASGIFVGLAVKPNVFVHPRLVPGEQVRRLRDDVVYVDAVEGDLEMYLSPAERYHEAEKAFDEVS